MKALVCGGRYYDEQDHINEVLSSFENGKGERITHLIHGGAKGVDSSANRWAVAHNIPTTIFAADWDRFGNSAGPIRNKQMLIEGKPDVVIAFPGGKGTSHMVAIAKRYGVLTVCIK